MSDPQSTANILRYMDGHAAVEVGQDHSLITAGESHVQVYSGNGAGDPGTVSITAASIGIVAPPSSIKFAGIMSFNPMAFVPGSNTFIITPPSAGLTALSKMLSTYASMMSALAGAA